MNQAQTPNARKRPVNLTLSESLVSQAREMTPNLSAVVEALLADYIAKHNKARQDKAKNADRAVQTWNAFNERHGSFADEHSTL
jgi:antitoxin CcdA